MQSNPSSCPVVRPAGVADVVAMFRVRTSVKENTLSPEELIGLGITPQAIAEAVGSAPCAWVAEVDGEVQGFSMVDLEAACLFAAFVLPEREGQGLGRLLVEAAETALFERHPVAWLETDAGSRAAGFYQRLGWAFEAGAGGGDVRLVKQRP
jgi:GNAT superfamily N-acetyltransferase